MILIIGIFDPTWKGNAGFGVIILAFLGGPFIAVIGSIPFMWLGQRLRKSELARPVGQLIRLALPLVVFTTLAWWNDIVLYDLQPLWNGERPSAVAVLLSLLLTGIIPFRLAMLLKPPFSWQGLLVGFVAMAVYFSGVLAANID